MINNIGKYIDYITKFINRFKTFVFLVIVGILIFYIITGRISKNQAIKSATELAEKVSGLDLEKDLLIGQKLDVSRQRDSLINENYFLKEERDSIRNREIYYENLSWKYKRERNDARRLLPIYTPNQNYSFLDTEAYPFTGEKIYIFNANQMFGMRETFLENDFCKKELDNKEEQLNNCKKELAISDNIETNSDTAMEMAEEEIAVDSTILAIEEEKNDLIMDEFNKNRRKERWKKVWNVAEKVGYAVGGFFVGTLTK